MAEVNPPWALQNLSTHTANVNRMFMQAVSDRAEGVVGAGDLLVAQRGSGANMSVDIAIGACVIFGDENLSQGMYGCVNDAIKNVVITAADPTNPRRDLIVARVKDAFYSGATNAWSLEVITGTAAPSPADPAMVNNAICLARVAVAAAAGSITNANITDLRPGTANGIIPVNSARRPGTLYGPYSQEPGFKPTPFAGLPIYETDTHSFKAYTTATTGYVPPWNMPWGVMAYAQVVANQTALGTGPTDLTGLTTGSITYVANRRIRITGQALFAASGGGGGGYMLIREGATQFQNCTMSFGSSSDQYTMLAIAIITPSAGAHTYKLMGGKNAFNVDLLAATAVPAFILVEDIGPNGTPA